MALGAYGTIRPADVSPSDVEILLHLTKRNNGAGSIQTLQVHKIQHNLRHVKCRLLCFQE